MNIKTSIRVVIKDLLVSMEGNIRDLIKVQLALVPTKVSTREVTKVSVRDHIKANIKVPIKAPSALVNTKTNTRVVTKV